MLQGNGEWLDLCSEHQCSLVYFLRDKSWCKQQFETFFLFQSLWYAFTRLEIFSDEAYSVCNLWRTVFNNCWSSASRKLNWVSNRGVRRSSDMESIKCSSTLVFFDQSRRIRENTDESRPVEKRVLYDEGGMLLKYVACCSICWFKFDQSRLNWYPVVGIDGGANAGFEITEGLIGCDGATFTGAGGSTLAGIAAGVET